MLYHTLEKVIPLNKVRTPPPEAPEPEEAEQPLSPELMSYLNELDGRRRA